jgi:hypothetical protein
MFPPKLLLAGTCLSVLLLGCQKDAAPPTDNCVCTRDYRYNICVTLNGSATWSDSLTFIRQLSSEMDTLSNVDYQNHCFGEYVGSQRIFMLRNGVKLDSSAIFVTKTEDCCHGEAHTVNFTR